MGVATTCIPNGLGPPDPTKYLAHCGDILGQLLSRNRVNKIFIGGNGEEWQIFMANWALVSRHFRHILYRLSSLLLTY